MYASKTHFAEATGGKDLLVFAFPEKENSHECFSK